MGNRRLRFAFPGAVIIFGVAAVSASAFFGDFDPSFGSNGRVTTSVGVSEDFASDVAIQTDGKIVAVGATNTIPTGSTYDFAVVRYNADGSLDTTFDGDGIATTDFGGSDTASGVAIQSDGKLVVAGESTGGTGRDHALARYDTNGAPDMTFSTDGMLKTAVAPASNEDGATGVAVQSDGMIVVNGYADMDAPSDYDFTVLRYTTGGTLDPVFDGDAAVEGNGIVTVDFAGEDDGTNEVAIQTDGKIVAGGSSEVVGGSEFALIRLHGTSGKLDNNAGDADPTIHLDEDGRLTTSFGSGTDAIRGIALQSDGKIVAAGFADASVGTDAAIARYNPDDGSLDTGFDGDGGSGNGTVTTSFTPGANSESAQDVAVQPDDKLVVAGAADTDPGPGGNFNFALARYNGPTGTLDTSFAGDGTATPPLLPGAAADGARSVALEPGGNIVAAGFADVYPVGDIGVGRFGATVTVPDTTITSGPTGPTVDTTPTFAFDSPELGSTFECRFDGAAFAPCNGGAAHTAATALAAGDHTFDVRATDPFSHTDASPARASFTLPTCSGEIATIAGDAAANNLTGTAGRDVVAAGAGNDKVRGLGSGDLLCGGAGKDKLVGGPGKDRLLGEQGKDTLIGGKGRDKLIGGPGRDVQTQ